MKDVGRRHGRNSGQLENVANDIIKYNDCKPVGISGTLQMLRGRPVGIFDWLSFLLGVVAVFVYVIINSLSIMIHMTCKMLSALFFLYKYM